jgi:hypothetical protein
LFFLTSIFLYWRSSAFFIDHCGNEIISRTSDQPIEKEWKKTSLTTTEEINKSLIEKEKKKDEKKNEEGKKKVKEKKTDQNRTNQTF